MIHRFLWLLFVLSTFSGYAQNFKRGIFKDFHDLKVNQPSDSLDYEIEAVTKNLGSVLDSEEGIYYRLSIKKKEALELGVIAGFSDGKDLYVSPRKVFPGKKKSLFSKVDRINSNYYVFDYPYLDIDNYNQHSDFTGDPKVSWYVRKESLYYLDLTGYTAESDVVTEEYVSELLKNDPKLSKEFESQRRKEGLLLLFIMKLLDDGQNSDW